MNKREDISIELFPSNREAKISCTPVNIDEATPVCFLSKDYLEERGWDIEGHTINDVFLVLDSPDNRELYAACMETTIDLEHPFGKWAYASQGD